MADGALSDLRVIDLAQGIAVRIVDLPGELGESGDLRDYLNGRPAKDGKPATDPFGTAADLEALADAVEAFHNRDRRFGGLSQRTGT